MHWTVTQAQERLAESTIPFVRLFEHGTFSLEYYAPEEADGQTPHDQDEVYVVAAGEGYFVNGETRHPFRAGDVLFVPAGVVHRFEAFSADFATWVIFYGKKGGESSLTKTDLGV